MNISKEKLEEQLFQLLKLHKYDAEEEPPTQYEHRLDQAERLAAVDLAYELERGNVLEPTAIKNIIEKWRKKEIKNKKK